MRKLFRRWLGPLASPKSVSDVADATPDSDRRFRAHRGVLPEPTDFNARRIADREAFNRRSQYWLAALGLAGLLVAVALMRRGSFANRTPFTALADLAAEVDLGPFQNTVDDWSLRVGPVPPTPTTYPMPASGRALPLGTPAGVLAKTMEGRESPEGSLTASTLSATTSMSTSTSAGTGIGTAPVENGAVAAGRLQVSGEKRPLVAGQVRQLMTGGCCTRAWWASDSTGLEFIDRPAAAPAPAIYRVALWPPAAEPEVIDLQLAERAATTRFTVRLEGNASVIHDVTSGKEWRLATGGNPLKLSETGSWAVWWDAPGGRAHFDTEVKIRASRLDGSDERELVGLWAGQVIGFYDEHNVIVSGRLTKETTDYGVWAVDVLAGNARLMANGSWLSGLALSPDRRWLVYSVSLNRSNKDANGVWVVATTPESSPRKLAFEGAYRWRDAARLVYVPFEPGATSHSLWQVDLSGGEPQRLFDPALVHIRIAGNDWSISPDGATMAFVAVEDHNLWVVDLP